MDLFEFLLIRIYVKQTSCPVNNFQTIKHKLVSFIFNTSIETKYKCIFTILLNFFISYSFVYTENLIVIFKLYEGSYALDFINEL